MSKFTRKITPSDLPETFLDDLMFKPLDKGLNCDDGDYSWNDITNQSRSAQLLSARQIAEMYDLEMDTAEKMSLYQYAALDDVNDKINDLISGSERYLQIKPYINDKRYEHSILYEYVRLSKRSNNFTQSNFDPIKNLKRAIGGGIISLALLAMFVLAILAFSENGSLLDNLLVTIPAVLWLGFTIYALVWDMPRAYRTRKLVMSLFQKNK